MATITVIGSMDYDITTYINLIPDANETNIADDVQYNLGGKGFNQCIGLTKSRTNNNLKIRMVGCVGGKDKYGELFLDALNKNNVVTDDIKTIPEAATGLANIIVESGRNHANRIMVFPGANKHTKFELDDMKKLFSKTDKEFIVLQNEIPEPLAIIDYLARTSDEHSSKFIVYNPSPFNAVKYTGNNVWSTINVLVVNEIEMFQLAETLNVVSQNDTAPDDKSEGFVDFFLKLVAPVADAINYPQKPASQMSGIIIITLGANGYIYYNHYTKTLKFERASKLIGEPIDSTGCGDTFLGYFTTTIAEKLDSCDGELDDKVLGALKIANIAAGIAVTRIGASSSIPYRAEVRDLFNL